MIMHTIRVGGKESPKVNPRPSICRDQQRQRGERNQGKYSYNQKQLLHHIAFHPDEAPGSTTHTQLLSIFKI
jgi:hypothetical protein